MRYIAMVLSICLLGLVFVGNLSAQDRFDFSAKIWADTLDIGGFGYLVSGVDFDNDGKVEIYAVNNDWRDKLGYDLVPRIYKYEKDDEGNWQVVWSTRLPLEFQNTWPALTYGDLDKDGKMEIIWGPVNNFGGGSQPNPPRIVVFETVGDGSDNMGVDNGDGTWRPNSQWTVINQDNTELRFVKFVVADVDADGTDEVIAISRRGGDGIYIMSVDNIPDNGDTTETWQIEYVGGQEVPTSGWYDVYWDLAVVGNAIYGFKSDDTVYAIKWNGNGYDESYQAGVAGSPWLSAQVVDVDNDGTKEILTLNGWLSSAPGQVLLLKQQGDSLASYVIADVPAEKANRLYGGAVGDLDNDGNLDYVFGTRYANPYGLVFRVEYQGGDPTDAANWTLTAIDSLQYGPQFDIFNVANLDDDPEDEVIYTGIPRGVSSSDPPPPIIILENIPENQPVIREISDVPNDQGRQVWVVWRASGDDKTGPRAANSGEETLAVFAPKGVEVPAELLNEKPMNVVRVPSEPQSEAAAAGDIQKYVIWRIDNDYPVQVAEITPIQADYYAAVVPTLGDGEDWAGTFVVSAHTSDVTTLWKSYPKTGMSEDNLIPTAPSVVASVEETGTGLQVVLEWNELPDPDINYFSIRRSTDPNFDPNDPTTEIGATTELNFVDNTVEVGKTYYYVVVAYDFNGNQGEFSNEVVTQVTGIADDFNNLPTEYALYQNYPNPFNPSTTIAFDLPKQSEVVVTIYNVMGQKVRTLVNGSLNAGHHEVVWDGRNDFGMPVAGGVYIYTIKAGDFTKSMKMTLIK